LILKQFIHYTNAALDHFAQRLTIRNRWLLFLFTSVVFLVSLHLLFTSVGIYKFIHSRPTSIHASAQTQRASVALNYYRNDMNFFEPRIQRYIDGPGITGVEFPIIYYTAAICYKTFGFDEIYMRLIDLLIVVLGFFMFYRLALMFIKNSFLAILLVGSAAISPVLLYYSPNFLPDAPSMALALISWYHFFKYVKERKEKHMNLFVVFAVFGALIKAIAILNFMIVLSLIILDRLGYFRKSAYGTLFEYKLRSVFKILVGTAVIFCWYYYAHYITIKYNNQTFALKPIMVDDWEAFKKVWVDTRNYWGPQYYAYETYVLMMISVVVCIVAYKLVDRLLLTVTVLYVLGSCCYIFFFTNQFRDHDYYIIAILPMVFFLLLTFGDVVYKITSGYTRMLAPIIAIILVFNLKESITKTKRNYYNRYLYEREYLSGMDYRPYYDLEPVLRAHGIKRTDKTVSLFDHSYCGSLYLMDQLGVTYGNYDEPATLKLLLELPNIKYAVVSDSARMNKVYPGNGLASKVLFTHRGLLIYKLR
jgi:hypothetical protein